MRGELRGWLCSGVLPVMGLGVVVSGRRWPGQPRFLRDPPCERDMITLAACKCVLSRVVGVRLFYVKP